MVVLRIVSQIPAAWTGWPYLPDPSSELGRAALEAEDLAEELKGLGLEARTRVEFSLLSASEAAPEIEQAASAEGADRILVLLGKRPPKYLTRTVSTLATRASRPVTVAKVRGGEGSGRGHPAQGKVLAPAWARRGRGARAAAAVLRQAWVLVR